MKTFHCTICGKAYPEDKVNDGAYFWDGVVKCQEHPGVEEWYEALCRQEEIELFGHVIDLTKARVLKRL